MAKKAKTPAPPRRVQAPKTRTSGSTDERRTRMLLYGFAAAGVVVLAVVAAFLSTRGGSSGGGNVPSLMKSASCTFKTVKATVPAGKPTHVSSLTAKLDWNTFPPSNGQHYPAWGVWGFYTDAVNPRMVVHNEEHGGVVLWWGPDTPTATVGKLNDLYSEDPPGMFGTPLPGLGSKVAITAWTGDPTRYTQKGYYGEGHVAVCPRYDDKTKAAFEAFRDEYRGKGPEGVPMSANQPGMGPQSG